MWTDLSTVLLQFTRVMDGRTDGQTEFSSLDRICIPCSAIKIGTDLSSVLSQCMQRGKKQNLLNNKSPFHTKK